MSDPILRLAPYAESCVFSKQSLPPFHCNPTRLTIVKMFTMWAHLLPKLRCYFAEFLNQSSLKRLSIFYLSTCVGLRYGHQCECIRGFSWKHGINHFAALRASSSRLGVNKDPDLPKSSAYTLEPGLPTPGWPILLRPPLSNFHTSGTGILTRFPSTTLFSLALGAD